MEQRKYFYADKPKENLENDEIFYIFLSIGKSYFGSLGSIGSIDSILFLY